LLFLHLWVFRFLVFVYLCLVLSLSADWLVKKAELTFAEKTTSNVWSQTVWLLWPGLIGQLSVTFGGTVAAAPPPFRPGNPALCGSRPLVTPYYCRLGDLYCVGRDVKHCSIQSNSMLWLLFVRSSVKVPTPYVADVFTGRQVASTQSRSVVTVYRHSVLIHQMKLAQNLTCCTDLMTSSNYYQLCPVIVNHDVLQSI